MSLDETKIKPRKKGADCQEHENLSSLHSLQPDSRGDIALPRTLLVDIGNTVLKPTGDWQARKFTIDKPQMVLFRFTSDYAAQAAVIAEDQLKYIKANKRFTGFGQFDQQNGTISVNLRPGKYYLAVRNGGELPNQVRVELHKPLAIPAAERLRFMDVYFQKTQSVPPTGGKFLQPFTVQAGCIYLLSGCNSGLEAYMIDPGEIENFRNNRPFHHIRGYGNPNAADAYPGLMQVKLPPGEYVLALRNQKTMPKTITFSMERWLPDHLL